MLAPGAKVRTRAAGLLLGVLLSLPSLASAAVIIDAFEFSHDAVIGWPVFLTLGLAIAAALWLPWLILRRAQGLPRPWATAVSSFAVVFPCVLIIDVVIGTAAVMSDSLTIAIFWSGDYLVPVTLLACAVSLLLSVAVALPVVPAFARSSVRRAPGSTAPPASVRS